MPAAIIGAGVLARHVAEPRHDAVERAEGAVELRRRLLLRQHLVEAERRQELLQIGDGQAKLAVEPAGGDRPSDAARHRDGVALLHARALDLDAAAGGLQFAEARRPGLWRKILQAAQHRGDVGVHRRRRRRMPGRRGGGGKLEHHLDHRIVLHRAGHQTAVEVETVRP